MNLPEDQAQPDIWATVSLFIFGNPESQPAFKIFMMVRLRAIVWSVVRILPDSAKTHIVKVFFLPGVGMEPSNGSSQPHELPITQEGTRVVKIGTPNGIPCQSFLLSVAIRKIVILE